MTAGTRGFAALSAATIFLAAHPCHSEPKAVQPAKVQKAACCGGEYDSGGPGGFSGPAYNAGPPIGGAPFDTHYGSPHGAPAPFPGPLEGGYGGGFGGGYGGPIAGPGTAGPPPGTVGMTYRRPSRIVPADKHPRAGIVDISVESAYDVTAEGMKSFRAKDGIWRLETKEPLIPGLPHIYHIKATLGEEEDAPVEYRTVRLIPGRIVDLQW